MRNYSFENGGKTWERVTKKQARAAYDSGFTVLFCPVKMRLFTPWHLEAYVDKSCGREFNTEVNSFEYYNCNSETGRYTAFYIQVEGATG